MAFAIGLVGLAKPASAEWVGQVVIQSAQGNVSAVGGTDSAIVTSGALASVSGPFKVASQQSRIVFTLKFIWVGGGTVVYPHHVEWCATGSVNWATTGWARAAGGSRLAWTNGTDLYGIFRGYGFAAFWGYWDTPTAMIQGAPTTMDHGNLPYNIIDPVTIEVPGYLTVESIAPAQTFNPGYPSPSAMGMSQISAPFVLKYLP
jgi:hypothetical protein